MVDMLHSNAVYTPHLYLYSGHKRVYFSPVGNRTDTFAGRAWSGDILYLSGGSPLMRKTMASDLMITIAGSRLSKLERIKQLVVSGKYRIDAEQLAEKMVGVIAGAFVPIQ